MSPSIAVSVVIPAYNEEERLPRTLEQIHAHFSKGDEPFEILVVDDGSSDRTGLLGDECEFPVRTLKLVENQGKGAAVAAGMQSAAGESVLFTDADLSVPIDHADALLSALENGSHVAIGSRRAQGAEIVVHQPLLREWSGRVFNLLVQVLLLPGMFDTQCGFKALRADAAQNIAQRLRCRGFCFDVELLVIARELGLTITEVPVRWYNSPATRVRFFRDSLRMFGTLFAIARRRFQGEYR